jgi:Zn-dependent protease
MNGEIIIIAVVIALWIAVYLVLKMFGKDKIDGKLEVGPATVMVGSSFLNNWFKASIERHRRAADVFFALGAIATFFALLYSLYYLGQGAYDFLHPLLFPPPEGPPPQPPPTLALIIPFITIRGSLLLKILPGLALVLITHEILGHKLAFHTYGVKVKRVGIFFFLLLMGAFVEQDEEDFKKSKPMSRLKASAAGSYLNLILAGLFLLSLFVVYEPTAVSVITGGDLEPGSGAVVPRVAKYGPLNNFTDIVAGDVITGIDGTDIEWIYDYGDLSLAPSQNVTVEYYKQGASVGEEPKKAIFIVRPSAGNATNVPTILYNLDLLGIDVPETLNLIESTYYAPRIPFITVGASSFLYVVLFWGFVVSVGVAIFNMIPAFPFDGYTYVEALLDQFNFKGSRKKVVLYSVLAFALLLLLLNLVRSYFGSFFF